MSHVDFKKLKCHMSLLLIFPHVAFEFKKMPHVLIMFSPSRISLSSMSHVEFGSIFGKRYLLAIDHIMLALFWSCVPNMK